MAAPFGSRPSARSGLPPPRPPDFCAVSLSQAPQSNFAEAPRCTTTSSASPSGELQIATTSGRAIEGVTPVTLESQIAVGSTRLTFQRGGLPASVFRHLPENFLRTSRYSIGEAIVEGRTSTIFEARDTAGFGLGLSFIRSLAHVTYDYRQPINARRGGYYRLDVSRFDDRRNTFHGFSRLDLDLRQYVSFLAERRVLVGRMKIATTDADARLPFST